MLVSARIPAHRSGLLAALAAMLAFTGCASTTTYVRPDTVTKTMEFSDTDLRMNAETMVNSMVGADFLQGLDRKPVLAFAGVQNRTSEQIDTKSLENTIATALFKSGRFEIVDRDIVKKAAQEKALVDLQRTDVADAVKLGGVLGAEYFLTGEMSSIDNTQGNRAVNYKKLSMRLVNVKTTSIAWMEEKEIKKATR